MFPLFFTPLSIVLLSVAFLLAVWVLVAGWNAARMVARAPLPLTHDSLSDSYFSIAQGEVGAPAAIADEPALSVVVYVTDSGESLRRMVELFTTQRTTFRYEIIAVCNASAKETAAFAKQFEDVKGLRFTFIPPETRNLSRRKLAFTVGIKAARGEVVLLTGSNLVPSSVGWFQLMAEPLLASGELKMVIGTSVFNFSSMKGLLGRYRSFLWVMDKCSSLAAALRHVPYRGDWENMALRRSFFFDAKGFASTVHIETGDDDLFIINSEVGSAVQAVVAPAAMPRADWGEWSDRIWNVQRAAYAFTASFLPRKPFLINGGVSLCNWLVLLCLAAAAVAPLLAPVFSWLPAGVAFLMYVAFLSLQICFYKGAALRLMQPSLLLTMPLCLLWRPFGNLIYRFSHRETMRRNYTWQH